jgi:hypothetical protein
LISFNPPVTIICSCRTIYFPHNFFFKRHQFIYHMFLKYTCFGNISYCGSDESVTELQFDALLLLLMRSLCLWLH